jgi:hypothetical protein
MATGIVSVALAADGHVFRSACTRPCQSVGRAAGRPAIVAFGRDWTWIALAARGLVAAATVVRAAQATSAASRCHHRRRMRHPVRDGIGGP